LGQRGDVPELLDIGWVVLGLVLLYFGAEWLVQGASELAIRFGISPLVVGLTVVAFGTSAPELVVSVKANFEGNGGMAIGNVVGSNICNIALVLALGAVIYPLAIQRQVIRREMPVLLVSTAVFLLMMRDGVVDRVEAGILFGGVVLYIVTSLVQAQSEDINESDDVPAELVEAARNGGKNRIYFNLFLVVVGALVLVAGADRMVFGGERIARFYGVPEAIIGLTLFQKTGRYHCRKCCGLMYFQPACSDWRGWFGQASGRARYDDDSLRSDVGGRLYPDADDVSPDEVGINRLRWIYGVVDHGLSLRIRSE